MQVHIQVPVLKDVTVGCSSIGLGVQGCGLSREGFHSKVLHLYPKPRPCTLYLNPEP